MRIIPPRLRPSPSPSPSLSFLAVLVRSRRSPGSPTLLPCPGALQAQPWPRKAAAVAQTQRPQWPAEGPSCRSGPGPSSSVAQAQGPQWPTRQVLGGQQRAQAPQRPAEGARSSVASRVLRRSSVASRGLQILSTSVASRRHTVLSGQQSAPQVLGGQQKAPPRPLSPSVRASRFL